MQRQPGQTCVWLTTIPSDRSNLTNLTPAFDALREGYESLPVVGAIGSTTLEADDVGSSAQAGGQPPT